jgi:putative hemolysin
LLPYARAQRAGGFYSATEFDLTALAPMLPAAVEAGRACVDRAHRNGMVIMLLWSGIAGYAARHGARYLLGSASIPVGQDPQGVARAIYNLPSSHYLGATPEVKPRNPFPLALLGANPATVPAALPPLLQSYLRAGAKLGGQPHWDESFGTADLLVWMDFESMQGKYAKRFFKHPVHA